MLRDETFQAEKKRIPAVGQRIKLAGFDHSFPVSKVVETNKTDAKGNVVYTIFLRDSTSILTNKYVDSETGEYEIVEDSKAGMIFFCPSIHLQIFSRFWTSNLVFGSTAKRFEGKNQSIGERPR